MLAKDCICSFSLESTLVQKELDLSISEDFSLLLACH